MASALPVMPRALVAPLEPGRCVSNSDEFDRECAPALLSLSVLELRFGGGVGVLWRDVVRGFPDGVR